MLVKKNLVLRGVLSPEVTINDAKDDCIKDFYNKVYKVFFDCDKNEFDQKSLNLTNYDVFNRWYSKLITLNAENIVYEETITDVYDLDINEKIPLSEDIIKWIKKSLHETVDTCEDDNCYYLDQKGYARIDEDFSKHGGETFGKGEFPFLCFKIYRIGDHNYYGYSITR